MSAPSRDSRPRRLPALRSRRIAPYLFIAPFFALFLVFGLFPLLFSIYLSLQQWNPAEGLHTMHWVGLENYGYALTDPWFWDALYNTAWFALVSGLPQHLVARYIEITRQSVFYLDPHVCMRCRYRSTELLWQCPHCHEWNTFVEERIAPAKDSEATLTS